MTKRFTISKTKYVMGMRCLRLLWKSIYSPEEKQASTESEILNMEEGTMVGIVAQDHPWFKNGILIEEAYDKKKVIAQTIWSMKDKNVNHIYEGGFYYEYTYDMPCFIRVDILQKNKDGTVDLIEVKSSSKTKEEQLIDIAFQKWVLTKCGYKVRNSYLMKLNKEYVKNGSLDLESLFVLENVDMDEKFLRNYFDVENNLDRFKPVLNSENEPEEMIGSHCKSPYVCPFISICQKHVDKYSVEKLSRLSKKTRAELHKFNIEKIQDIPPTFGLTDKQNIQRKVAVCKKPHLDMEAIKHFLNDLQYPLYHLDFEAMNRAIPIYDGMRPNQFLIFQASIHKEYKNKSLKHFEYLQQDKIDPRLTVINFLLNHLGKKGDIIVYSKAFEATRIKELALQFPEYSIKLLSLIDRMKDLALPFQYNYFYHEDFEGSFSIKKVLPVLVPDLSYKSLKINNGADAQAQFSRLIDGKLNKDEAQEVVKSLLTYCKLDTYAMVKILRVLYSWLDLYKDGISPEAIVEHHLNEVQKMVA